MVVCTMNWVEIIVSNHVTHGAKCHLNISKLNCSIYNRIQSALKAAVGLLESCHPANRYDTVGRWAGATPCRSDRPLRLGVTTWSPAMKEKGLGHACIAGVTMNIFSLAGEGEVVWGRRGEGCVLLGNPRKKFQYQIQGPDGMMTRWLAYVHQPLDFWVRADHCKPQGSIFWGGGGGRGKLNSGKSWKSNQKLVNQSG